MILTEKQEFVFGCLTCSHIGLHLRLNHFSRFFFFSISFSVYFNNKAVINKRVLLKSLNVCQSIVTLSGKVLYHCWIHFCDVCFQALMF